MRDLPLTKRQHVGVRQRCAIRVFILAAAVSLVPASQPAFAQSLSGYAQAGDGDSLSVGGASVRLFGIDAPELAQTCNRGDQAWPCGEEAKSQLQAIVAGRRIDCRGLGYDDYGRMVAICSVSGAEINRLMVDQGWATAFRKYSTDYVEAETAAKAAGRGIWSSTFDEPAAYRLAHPRKNEAPASGGPAQRFARAQPQYRSSGCDIKGNHSRRGEWIYHLPGMPYYAETRAEQMFCSEAEAQAAGYRRARVRN